MEPTLDDQRARALIAGSVRALDTALARGLAEADLAAAGAAALYQALVVEALRRFALAAAGHPGIGHGRLFERALMPQRIPELPAAVVESLGELPPPASDPPRELGLLLEGLLAHGSAGDGKRIVATRQRKLSGSYFTPYEITLQVARAALREASGGSVFPALRLCDPAVGAGAFLLGACDVLLAELATERGLPASQVRRALVAECLYGMDISPLAVAVTEAALWLYAGDPEFDIAELRPRLRLGDTLLAPSLAALFPEVFAGERGGFDLVIGNPPWVAYAGRAAQPLTAERRKFFQKNYAAFKGYPTLHALFVERAAALAPHGGVALLLPSPLADLDGYRPVRRTLTRSHSVCEPLLEFGQDAFGSVTQPCFALIARARSEPGPGDERPFRLVERQRLQGAAAEVAPPAALLRLLERPPLPRELFGEMGFQSRRAVTERLFRRGTPGAGHDYPLLEGKDVSEFRVGAPRLFLKADRPLLAKLACRLRAEGDYVRARFVVRQTAKVPIAALHSGLPFRNTLLAGFEHERYSAELVVGLLNSALYRALHLAARRDARQAVFPQVKVAHLRALPQPPEDAALWRELVGIVGRATAGGIDGALRFELDTVVFQLFDLGQDERTQIVEFVAQRAPELGHQSRSL